jgi:hypothetical protein
MMDSGEGYVIARRGCNYGVIVDRQSNLIMSLRGVVPVSGRPGPDVAISFELRGSIRRLMPNNAEIVMSHYMDPFVTCGAI